MNAGRRPFLVVGWLPVLKRGIMLIVVMWFRTLYESGRRRTITARHLGIFFVGMCLFNATSITTAIVLVKLGARGWEFWTPVLVVMIGVLMGYSAWVARIVRSTSAPTK